MKMKMKVKVKLLVFILTSVLLIILAVNLIYIWLIIAKTPEGAVLKYSRMHGLKYSSQNVKIQEGTYVYNSYGKQFTVDGIKDEWGESINFFYLKERFGTWYVTMAGTGP